MPLKDNNKDNNDSSRAMLGEDFGVILVATTVTGSRAGWLAFTGRKASEEKREGEREGERERERERGQRIVSERIVYFLR